MNHTNNSPAKVMKRSPTKKVEPQSPERITFQGFKPYEHVRPTEVLPVKMLKAKHQKELLYEKADFK